MVVVSLRAIIFIFWMQLAAVAAATPIVQVDCNVALKHSASEPYGQVRSTFQHTDRYTVELDLPHGVKNQCSTSFCHLYAWAASLETPGKVEISTDYLSATFLLKSMLKALDDGNVHFAASLGAGPIDSLAHIREVGLMPSRAWVGVSGFNRNPLNTRMLDTFQAIIARAVDLHTKEEAKAELLDAFQSFVGSIPQRFEYEGESYTPQGFAISHFPEIYRRPIKISVQSDVDLPSVGTETPDAVEIVVSLGVFAEAARAVLDSGTPVWLAYQHRHQFSDDATGIMSVSAFNYPPLAAPLTRAMRDQHTLWNDSHAVLLVGYELDADTQRVRKWKIRNSWGEISGDRGVYHMYADYFQSYAFSFTYLDDGKVPIPRHLGQSQPHEKIDDLPGSPPP